MSWRERAAARRCRPSCSTATRTCWRSARARSASPCRSAIVASLAEAAAAFADALPVWPVPIGAARTGGADAAIVAAIEAGDRSRGGGRGAGAGDQPDRQAHARSGRSCPIPATPSSWPSWRCGTARPAAAARHDAGGGRAEGRAGHRAHPAVGRAAARSPAPCSSRPSGSPRRRSPRTSASPRRASPLPGSIRMPAKAA